MERRNTFFAALISRNHCAPIRSHDDYGKISTFIYKRKRYSLT
nr:MAG TPA: hypothetical protein [Caudoviricetes sp.]